MLINKKITLFSADNNGIYQNCGTYPAWVYRSMRIRNRGAGVRTCDSITVRIAKTKGLSVGTGDLIYFGETKTLCPNIAECRRVAKVTENNFGLRPHWCIEAENEYR